MPPTAKFLKKFSALAGATVFAGVAALIVIDSVLAWFRSRVAYVPCRRAKGVCGRERAARVGKGEALQADGCLVAGNVLSWQLGVLAETV